MTRDELIEAARAWAAIPGSGMLPLEEAVADFALPLLAQARREAIEECATVVEGDCFGSPRCNSYAHDDVCPFVNPGQAVLALARGGRQDEKQSVAGPSLAGSAVTQQEASSPPAAPLSSADAGALRTRASQLLILALPSGYFDSRHIDAMLAFGEEQYMKANKTAYERGRSHGARDATGGDADVLDRAAEILDGKDDHTALSLRMRAQVLRQPRPAPEAEIPALPGGVDLSGVLDAYSPSSQKCPPIGQRLTEERLRMELEAERGFTPQADARKGAAKPKKRAPDA